MEDRRQPFHQVLAHSRQLAERRQLAGECDQLLPQGVALGEEAAVDHPVQGAAQGSEQQPQQERRAGDRPHRLPLLDQVREDGAPSPQSGVEDENQRAGQQRVDQAAPHRQLDVEQVVAEDGGEEGERVEEQDQRLERVGPGRQPEPQQVARRDHHDEEHPGDRRRQHEGGLLALSRLGLAERLRGEEQGDRQGPQRKDGVLEQVLDPLDGPGEDPLAEGLLAQVGGAARDPRPEAGDVIKRHDPGALAEPPGTLGDQRGEVHLDRDLKPGQQVVRREGKGEQKRPSDDVDRQRDLHSHGGAEGEQQADPEIRLLGQGEERHGEKAQGRQHVQQERQPADRGPGDDREGQNPVGPRHPQQDRPSAFEPPGRVPVIQHPAHAPAARGEDLVAGPQPSAVRRPPRVDPVDMDPQPPLGRQEAEPLAGGEQSLLDLEEEEA